MKLRSESMKDCGDLGSKWVEKDSGIFFNVNFLEEKVIAGEWEELEKYLLGFTTVEDNSFSMKMFFNIRKQKYLEAIDRNDTTSAIEILRKDFKVFSAYDEDINQEMCLLMTLENFRENERFRNYRDAQTSRREMVIDLKKLIEANPVFRGKLVFPSFSAARLSTIVNQSLNLQHSYCQYPRPLPVIETLLTDHVCEPLNVVVPSASAVVPSATVANCNPYPSGQVHGGPSCSAWATPSTSRQHATLSLENLPRNFACTLHQGSAVTSLDFHPSHCTLLLVGSTNGEVTLWELRTEEKVATKPFMVWDMYTRSLTFQVVFARNRHISVIRAIWSPDGGFIGVAFNKYLIHLYAYVGPDDLQQLLEVEAHNGLVNDLAFVCLEDRLCIATCGDDKLIKVWDLNGQKLFSFAGHQAPVYSICPHQTEDIQFILSTSIDGKIKVWLFDNLGSRIDLDAPGRWCTTLRYSDDGRMFSCGTSREGDSFLVEWDESQGTIKRTYGGLIKKPAGTVVHFDTTQNQFLAVGEDSQIKFWDMNNANLLISTHAEGGLSSQPRLRFNKEGNLLAVSTTGNGIKILATAASLRSLRPVETSCFRSSTRPTEFKASSSSVAAVINAIAPAAAMLRSANMERSLPAGDSSTPILPALVQIPHLDTECGDESISSNIGESGSLDGVPENPIHWRLSEITRPVQCQQITIPRGNSAATKVLRVVYPHSSAGLLALGSDGIVTVWKWQSEEQNPSGKATTRVLPQQWKPKSPNTENVMATEHASGVHIDDSMACLSLSRTDSYVLSAYGGMASVFDVRTFKEVVAFMTPPPTATCIQYYPLDNNIVAIGLDDSAVSIYQVRKDEEIAILEGHRRGITGLTFSTHLKILVSAGGDGMLCSWNTDTWVKIKSVPVNILAGAPLSGEIGPTGVQFHPDHIHLLVTQQRLLAVYNALTMERINDWTPRDALFAPITSTTYSGDGHLVYASFRDGSVWVLEASTLRPRCRIASSAYNVVTGMNGGEAVYPLSIAANPRERNQFAIGLTNGSVKVIEPLESEGEWGKDRDEGDHSDRRDPEDEPKKKKEKRDEGTSHSTPVRLFFV